MTFDLKWKKNKKIGQKEINCFSAQNNCNSIYCEWYSQMKNYP